MRQIKDFARAFDLRGHHVLRTVRDESGYRIGCGFLNVKVEIRQPEHRTVHIENPAHYRLIPVMRAHQREVLRCEEAERLPRREHHRAEQHLEGDFRVLLQQVRADPCALRCRVNPDFGGIDLVERSQIIDGLVVYLRRSGIIPGDVGCRPDGLVDDGGHKTG